MKSAEIRKVFLEFFKERGHTVVPSSSLLPPDPTLLFTNAGMNQFKPYFLGEIEPPFKRAVSVQKCLRAGGKHNDLDNVGFTRRHHTFFEMLGNFSFGDYFKREAIRWAWELLTEVFKIPKEKLWVTVYEEDDEAFYIWKDEIGIDESRIMRMGAKDNFWEMGDVGPCGPSSEILYDLGGEGEDRFLELWNLVFMQYNRRADGSLEALPKKNIDTGMGLERIASVLQGTYSNFETDLFLPIINFIEDISGVKYTYEIGAPHRVIADHTRALVFAISDGIYPSNFGRGYVLRRILRRAYRFAQKLNILEPIIYRVADVVIEIMGDVYPEIVENAKNTKEIIKAEEERFLNTLGRAIPVLIEKLEEAKEKGVLDGSVAFNLYDTYGVPQDMIEDWAKTYNVDVDWGNFRREMENARERSRKGSTFKVLSPDWLKIAGDYTASKFVGYKNLTWKSRVAKVGKLKEKDAIVCYETPFYPEGGGQVGDVGRIVGKGWEFEVEDTKRLGMDIIHYGKLKGNVEIGGECELIVSKRERDSARRAHTSTHLLHAALRSILGPHVRQQGSLVERDRLRFDFSHPKALTDEEIKEIELLVNSKIRENIPVTEEYKPYREAIKEGAMAIFEEKYGEIVRVISVGDFSKELCGGTHVDKTGDIGLFLIVKEESVSAGTRRIEALVGERAVKYVQENMGILYQLAEIFKVSYSEIPKVVSKKLEEIRGLENEIEKLYGLLADLYSEKVRVIERDGYKVKFGIFPLPKEALRKLGDRIQEGKSAIILASEYEKDRGFIHIRLGREVLGNLSAKDIMFKIAERLGGGGGGDEVKAEGKIRNLRDLEGVIEGVL
ncbi:MAG: alanine--tRNA ligase [Candidatus Caldipriscus sp.]|nr:alanine--tRNA ligase [Candidatus Caldipriscus sp.]